MITLIETPEPELKDGDRVVISAPPFMGAAGKITDIVADKFIVDMDEAQDGWKVISASIGDLIRSPYQNEPLEVVPSV